MAASLFRSRFTRVIKPFVRSSPRMSTLAVPVQQLVKTEALGKVFLIGLNRSEKRNCVNTETADELWKAFEEFEKNDDYYVAVLHGEGGNFCAGYDLSELASFDEGKELPADGKNLPEGRGPMGPSRKFFSKPVIAAVSGYAVAGGLELALMCDLRIADETAILGVFCRRFGVPLLDGGTVRLPKLIGLSRALDLILTGRPVDAKEALAMGLVNKVVPVGAGLGAAVNMAQTLCNFPQECMRRDRLSAYNSSYNASSFSEAVQYEWEKAKHVIASESVKGADRFVRGTGKSGSFDTFKSKL